MLGPNPTFLSFEPVTLGMPNRWSQCLHQRRPALCSCLYADSGFHISAFYTAKYGYKLCLRLYLNGDGTGKKTHLSLFIVIMKGEYDALLPWPFRNKVQGQGKQQGCGVGNRGPGPGLAMNWLCDLGESLALSALSVSPFIKQEPEFTSSSQGSLQHHESRGKNAWINTTGRRDVEMKIHMVG